MKFFRFFLLPLNLLAILLCATSCGYKFSRSWHDAERPSLSIAYIEGDNEGELAVALVKVLSSAGIFQYRPHGGDHLLKIKLIDFSDENIGFRYDRNNQGEVNVLVIPTEVRTTAQADVSVIEACSGRILFGPERVSAGYDYDYDNNVGNDNVFSLGQLTDQDSAQEMSKKPLFYILAQKILDMLVIVDHR